MSVSCDERVIEQSLESIVQAVDCLCILDNGMNDSTFAIIQLFEQQYGIPLLIVNEAFSLVPTAQKMLQELCSDLSSSYLLFLDPGTTLNHAEMLKKQPLVEDAYSCLSFKTKWGLCEKELFLAKASLTWEWPLKSDHLTFLPAIAVQEIPDETYRQKRLLQTIKSFDEGNPDQLFYLAQSYKALKEYQESIQLHKKYIHSNDHIEKIWFSHCMIAECYELMNNLEMSQHWFLQAYQCDPYRPESLHALASQYRKAGQNHLAYFFAKNGSRIPSSERTLWKERPFSPYLFEEELSICAYYTSHRDEGEAAANDLLLRKEAPWHIKDQTYKNLLFYVQKLQETHQMPIDFSLPFIVGNERYYPMNPSIRKTSNGYQVICRTVNYTQTGAKFFHTNDPTGVFRTRNFLLDYDLHFNLLSQKEIIEDLPRERIRSFNIEGLDDCRIFEFEGDVWFSCCTGDTNPFGNFQISLAKLSNSPQENSVQVEQLIPLLGPDPNRCEKNWLPFIRDEKIQLIYSYDPFILFTPNLETGACKASIFQQSDFDFSHMRGSGAPITFDEGYLLLVHEVVLNQDFSRCYLHRFLFLDKDLTITKISKPFFFKHHGVEYCCSIALDHTGKQLIIPIGIEDKEAYLHFYDCDAIRSLLFPIKNTTSTIFQHPF